MERRERLRQPSFAGFPLAIQQRNGRAYFETYGFFHDLACLRAWMHQQHTRLSPLQEKILMDYCKLEWHMSALPPPAAPYTRLRQFGGRYKWAEWRERANEHICEWRLADEAVRFGKQHTADLASMMAMDVPTVRTCPPSDYRAHQPGYNDGLDEFLS